MNRILFKAMTKNSISETGRITSFDITSWIEKNLFEVIPMMIDAYKHKA